MLEFLKRLYSLSRCGPQNGESARSDPIDIVKRSYYRLCVLAKQLDDHAEKAPYPQVAARLRQMAVEKRASADRLRERIVRLGAALEETSGEIRSAKNHWERVVQDLQDQKSLEAKLFDETALLAEERPELAELLRDVAASQRPHTETLLDLVARADPQADQT
jgi:rubrerythrin